MSDLAAGACLLRALSASERRLRIEGDYDTAREEFRALQRDTLHRLSVTINVHANASVNARLALFYDDPFVRETLARIHSFKIELLGRLTHEHVGFLVATRVVSLKFSSVASWQTSYEGFEALAESTALRSLWFDDTDFRTFATPLLRVLGASRSITRLRLSTVWLTDSDESTEFLRELAGATRLEDVEISNNNLRNSSGALRALARSAGLRNLDLACNRLGSQAMDVIAEFAQHCTRLQMLDLAGNQNVGGVVAFEKLSGFAESQSLTWLDMSWMGLRDGDIRTLRPLSACQSLRTLRLSGNELTDSCADDMLVFASAPSLRTLDLSANRISLHGARKLLQVAHLGFVVVCLSGLELRPRDAALLKRQYGESVVHGESAEWPLWT